ncbi:hypothetical protein EVG20_g3018 [Dentipellis fragilis]|uniref:Uncharacterized protein n=1 Tax=Dentipellis fragilis TaxID=205917 RepID=A0A4Y9Z5I8_9AGAM|nr:hypothetical protein EVG20_g3018 [Dentipellis fragilis]
MPLCGELSYRISISGLWAASVLHGLYTALFARSVYVLASRRPKKYYLTTTIILYALITANITIGLVQTVLTPTLTANSYFFAGADLLCGSGPETAERAHEASVNNLGNAIEDGINALAQYEYISNVAEILF